MGRWHVGVYNLDDPKNVTHMEEIFVHVFYIFLQGFFSGAGGGVSAVEFAKDDDWHI
jgi:hypothetical protein